MNNDHILNIARQQECAIRELQDMQVQIYKDVNKQFIPANKKLDEMDIGVSIIQKFELLENIAPCEFPNIYYVYKMDKSKKPKGDIQFKFKEKSSYCDRMALGSCKKYSMNCYTYNYTQKENSVLSFRCAKDCRCSYYCANRQEMKIHFTEPGENQYIGKVTDPYDMCAYVLHIHNENDAIEYVIEANCCQCYFWCRCPCEECQMVVFAIKDYRTNSMLSNIVRRGSGNCCENAIKDGENDIMDITFPNNSNWKQRARLMMTGVFLDYIYFEETQSSQDMR